MRCATPVTIITCGNTGGSNCIQKVQVQVLSLDNKVQCDANDFIAHTQAEFNFLTESPFRLSLAEGSIIGGAILAVWATAFGIRALVQSLGSGEPERT